MADVSGTLLILDERIVGRFCFLRNKPGYAYALIKLALCASNMTPPSLYHSL